MVGEKNLPWPGERGGLLKAEQMIKLTQWAPRTVHGPNRATSPKGTGASISKCPLPLGKNSEAKIARRVPATALRFSRFRVIHPSRSFGLVRARRREEKRRRREEEEK